MLKGVEEVFTKKGRPDQKKTYATTETRCNCTKWIQHSAPCRHVLFLRQSKGISMFSADLFANFYTKSRLDDLDVDAVADIDDITMNVEVEESDDRGEIQENVTLEPSEKYKLARDACTEVQELLCNFGTQQFREYLWEIEIVKRRMRRGLPILKTTKTRKETGEAEEQECDDVVPITEASEKLEVLAQVGKMEFKKGVKARGRPRYTGAGKLQFPKPKVKCKSLEKLKSNQKLC